MLPAYSWIKKKKMFFISGQSTTGGDFDTEGAKGHGLITYNHLWVPWY